MARFAGALRLALLLALGSAAASRLIVKPVTPWSRRWQRAPAPLLSSGTEAAGKGPPQSGYVEPTSGYELFDRTGHVFVVQADLRQLMADAVLFPTRSLMNREWFPDGPPDLGNSTLESVSSFRYTTSDRVRCARQTAEGAPAIWLGWVLWQCEGDPPVDWFVAAAEQFLMRAYDAALASADPPICGRQLPLLALPVIGTGQGGGSGAKGEVLVALMSLLATFVATRPVDVALVTRDRRMLSAAQAARSKRYGEGAYRGGAWDVLFGAEPRLRAQASHLASLSSTDQLVLFMGSGINAATNLPRWRGLLSELADQAGLGTYELMQLRQLSPHDQVKVLQLRLGRRKHERQSTAPTSAGGAATVEALQEMGTLELQRMACGSSVTQPAPRSAFQTCGCALSACTTARLSKDAAALGVRQPRGESQSSAVLTAVPSFPSRHVGATAGHADVRPPPRPTRLSPALSRGHDKLGFVLRPSVRRRQRQPQRAPIRHARLAPLVPPVDPQASRRCAPFRRYLPGACPTCRSHARRRRHPVPLGVPLGALAHLEWIKFR
eukprot:scaffold13680_cov128-Isochrysis_galbana.AAC.3